MCLRSRTGILFLLLLLVAGLAQAASSLDLFNAVPTGGVEVGASP